MKLRKLLLALLLTAFSTPSFAKDRCAPLLLKTLSNEEILKSSKDDLYAANLRFFRDLVDSSFAKAADIRKRRKEWRRAHPENPNGCPMPELKPVVGYLRAVLIERLKQQGRGAKPQVKALIQKMIRRGQEIIEDDVPYDQVNPYSAEFSTAMNILANNANVSPASAAQISAALQPPIENRPDWWFNSVFGSDVFAKQTLRGFKELDSVAIPFPFPIGFRSLDVLWLSGIYAIGIRVPPLDYSLGGARSMDDPETFQGHDYGHWDSQLELAKKRLPYDQVEKLFKKFEAERDRANLKKYGLSENDRDHFKRMVIFLNYVSDHENYIPFGFAKLTQQPSFSDEASFSESFDYDPSTKLGPNWQKVVAAARAWTIDFWKKNGVKR